MGGAQTCTAMIFFNMCIHGQNNYSLVPSPLSRTWREEVWTNMYRARVACATYSARQSDARIKSHDCTGMNGVHINDCAHVRLYALVPNGMLIYSRFLFMHTRSICDIVHSSAIQALYTFGQTTCMKGSWARD